MSRGLLRVTALASNLLRALCRMLIGRRGPVDSSVPRRPQTAADSSASAGLLVDHTRALVTAEESRVAALQARATALLTAIGVLVTVASAVGVLFAARQFNRSSVGYPSPGHVIRNG